MKYNISSKCFNGRGLKLTNERDGIKIVMSFDQIAIKAISLLILMEKFFYTNLNM